MNPVHKFSPYFPKIHSNIILPYTPMSFPFKFSYPNIVCISHLTHACYMSRPSHTTWFAHHSNIWWTVQLIKLFIMQSSPASCRIF
jgi:hypothetical protein